MSYQNGRTFTDFRAINLKAKGGTIRFETPDEVPTTTSGEYLLYVNASGALVFDNGSTITTIGAAGGGGSLPQWESIFGADYVFTITPGVTFEIAGNHADAVDVLTVSNIGGGSGDVIQISNSGSGKDISGTSATWSVTKAGVATFAGVSISGTASAIATTGAAVWTLKDNDATALSIGASGATSMAVFDTSNAAEKVTFTAVTVAVVGNTTLTGASNAAASLAVVNNTATTLGNGAALGVARIASTSLTTGSLLHLELTEGTLNGGHYLKAWDVTGGATVFSVGEDGAVVIAGAAGSNMLTVTAGDVLLSDASLTMVDADNAVSLSVTNNTATTANVFLFTGSGVFTGTGANSFFNITQSGATTGEVVSIIANGLTTGTALSVTSSGTIATTGELVSFVANSATTATALLRMSGTALTDGWVAAFTGGGANFTASGGMLGLAMGAATVGTGLSITTTGVYTGTTGLLDINAASATAGVLIDVNGAGVTTGTFIKLNATEATLTSGKYIECYDGAANDFSVAKYGATVIAGNAQGTAALTVTAGDLVLTAGNATVGGKFILSGTETIAAGGTSTALALTKSVHYIDADAGGDTFTLADGVAGQIMTILLTSSTGVATITPTNLAGGTSVTLNADGDSVVLQFMDTEWFILGGNSYAVV